MKYKYVFGPVPSRRLGISLGVDLVPHKTCTANCVYCECGRTTQLTVKRDEYVPADMVLLELDDCLSAGPDLDFITFSGAGEPTLHSKMGEIAEFIKAGYPDYKIALLTNGTLFDRLDVQDEAMAIDVVIASIDAASQDVFKKINRPHPDLSVESMVNGLVAFRDKFNGQFWIEVFLAAGINDDSGELERIAKAIRAVRPDRVQINTLDRPGTEPWVRPASLDSLFRARDFFGKADIITKATAKAVPHKGRGDIKSLILSTIRRRPCTINDIANALGINEAEARKYVVMLSNAGLVQSQRLPRGIFYETVKE